VKILAVMQNQWFHDPEEVRRIVARWPQRRRDLIGRFLFAGCKSGRVLKAVFQDRINDIIWEEASPEIGGESSSCFPADLEHLRATLAEVRPDIVLGFGKIACDALAVLVDGHDLVVGPHPTARGADTLPRLRIMAECLDNMVKHRSHISSSCSTKEK
jgi:hypothetical protein